MKLEVMYSARLDNVDDAVGPSSLSVSSAGNGIHHLCTEAGTCSKFAIWLLLLLYLPCELNSGKR
jgi:hypothetical protein